MQPRSRAIGRWLGIFAIAMLFIGPPIGQWRAAQQSSGVVLALSALAAVDTSSAGHHTADLTPGHSHSAGQAPSATPHGLAGQVGILVLDHCGYCHLAACFAALPGSDLPLPTLDWDAVPPLLAEYRAPATPTVSVHRARAPPVFHA